MEGELPASMSGSCGACVCGKLYVFGGYDDQGYSNRVMFPFHSGAQHHVLFSASPHPTAFPQILHKDV